MCNHILICQLVILLGIHIAFGNGQVYQTRTEIVCEPGNVKLQCAIGEVIHIISAFYGRTNTVTCSGKGTRGTSNQHCYTPGAKHVISQICDNKPECTVYARNEVFFDPCPGTTKYIEVHYICVQSDIKSTIICGHGNLALTCPSGLVIQIVNANYGRYNSVTCPQGQKDMSNIYCSAAGTREAISNLCNNKEECEVQYGLMLGNPCVGTYKYMDVQYRCVIKESLPVLLSTPPCGRVMNVSLAWDGLNWVHAEK